jgi:hypothetical protein
MKETEINVESEKFSPKNNQEVNSKPLKKRNEFKENLELKKSFELEEKFLNELNINYSEFDHQKGNLSPRMLFKKRKLEEYSNSSKKKEEKESFLNSNIRIANKIRNSFENLLDFVHETYFTVDINNNNLNENQNYQNINFKFTSLDFLINPLRQKFPWETWSPYEIALFYCCICKFGTNFQFYENIITTKTKEEIIDFYCSLKSSKYYKIWKNNKHKKNNKGKKI